MRFQVSGVRCQVSAEQSEKTAGDKQSGQVQIVYSASYLSAMSGDLILTPDTRHLKPKKMLYSFYKGRLHI